MLRTKGLLLGLLCLELSLAISCAALAVGAYADVLVFYREGCDDCRHMDELLEELQELYPGIIVSHIEEQEPGAIEAMWKINEEMDDLMGKAVEDLRKPPVFLADVQQRILSCYEVEKSAFTTLSEIIE